MSTLKVNNITPFTGNSVTISGQLITSGSSAQLTGSLFGSSSYATSASYTVNATTASFAATASYVANVNPFPFTGSAIVSGSVVVTGSMLLAYNRLIPGLSGWSTGGSLIVINHFLFKVKIAY